MLNFQITITLVLFPFVLMLMIAPAVFMMVQDLDGEAGLLGDIFTLLPPIPILFIMLFTTYQAVVNTVRALSEKPVRYPLSIQFVKQVFVMAEASAQFPSLTSGQLCFC